MKEFVTAAEEVAEGQEVDQGTPFTIDGVRCTAYRPGDGQLAVLMAMTTQHSSSEEQIAGLVNFLASVLDDNSHSYVVNRLLDRRDPFGLKQVRGIFEWLVETWSGRPTQSPSVSTQSQSSGGQKSTQPTPALT